MSIIPANPKLIHNPNQIIKAILKSPQPSHAHLETKICKKKNKNIDVAATNQLVNA
ncbi:MAG: hypothetical protein ACPHY8_03700 [Patescibacteria group bacterium]